MATLTKGMSYRRQGSSGLIWSDQNAIYQRHMVDEKPYSLQDQKPSSSQDQKLMMMRSLSTGSTKASSSSLSTIAMSTPSSSTTTAIPANTTSTVNATSTSVPASHHKGSFNVVKWIKKALTRMRRWIIRYWVSIFLHLLPLTCFPVFLFSILQGFIMIWLDTHDS